MKKKRPRIKTFIGKKGVKVTHQGSCHNVREWWNNDTKKNVAQRELFNN